VKIGNIFYRISKIKILNFFFFQIYSECEEENDKKIEVGWTMYKNIIVSCKHLQIFL